VLLSIKLAAFVGATMAEDLPSYVAI